MVPEGSKANVSLPLGYSQVFEIREKPENVDSEHIEGLQTGHFELSSGKYLIIAS